MKKNALVIIGASSSLTNPLISMLANHFEVVLVSRRVSVAPAAKIFVVDSYEQNCLKSAIDSLEVFEEIAVLFLNGVADTRAFYKLKVEEIKDIISVNISVPISVTNLILSTYLTKKLTFIYISSSRALIGDRGISVYSASKASLTSFVASMALEYGMLSHKFVVLSLGLFPDGLNSQVAASTRSVIFRRSAKQAFVSYNDLASAILFVNSNHSINGSTLKIDNGYR